MTQSETIAAIATPPGEGGIGIVRISGEDAIHTASKIFRPRGKKIGSLSDAEPYHAVYGDIIDGDDVIDEAIAIVMRAPRSYTREDICELQCHGGAVVTRAVLSLALKNGARLAERGEFTKRAYLNGRLDLSQAQSVMDIVGAKTESALRVAQGHLSGRFSGEIKSCRQKILGTIAHLEATIDFPEDDIDDVALDEARSSISLINEKICSLLSSAHTGRILRDGLLTAIIGRPNVGKSSLLNHMLREERAIVTDVPGTTRDSIEEHAEIAGVPLRIIDTAGIRETSDAVEKIGVKIAERYIDDAELVIAMLDSSQPLTDEDIKILSRLKAQNKDVIYLLNKSDLEPAIDENKILSIIGAHSPDVVIFSTKTSQGEKALEDAILKRVYGGKKMEADEGIMASTEREADILRRASISLRAALDSIESGMSEDFITIDLRAAWETLGEITGETVGDDIVDEIFKKFCLGK